MPLSLDILVTSADQVFGLIETRRQGSSSIAVISIMGPGERLEPLRRIPQISLLEISCLDIHDAADPHAPSMNQAREILRFADALSSGARPSLASQETSATLLIHCWAGISRSPAVALALLARQCGDPAAAARELERIRPQANPNRLFVERFDRLCGWDGRLFDAACRFPIMPSYGFEDFT